MKTRNAALFASLALASAGSAQAYDMNPIDVDCWGHALLCKTLKLTEKLKFPVHETMTLLAYDNYETPDDASGGAAKTSADVLKKSGRLRDLVLGSEWNDDPDSLLRLGITKATYWYALFDDAKLQAGCRKNPAAAQCKGKEITSDPMMLYRSHFGDLQFIHAMAPTDAETAADTKAKMMAWARFTYAVFVSDENLEKRAIDRVDLPGFREVAAIIGKPGWTVGALFDPAPTGSWTTSFNPLKFGHFESSGQPRQQNDYPGGDGRIGVRFVALGSLLHMVQDSYSDSHTARKGGCDPIARSKGEILAFRNYADQDPNDHGIADRQPDWLENGKLKTNNPLWASAQVLKFAFEKTAWDDGVGKFLDEKVFALKDPQAKPQPGDKNCFEGLN